MRKDKTKQNPRRSDLPLWISPRREQPLATNRQALIATPAQRLALIAQTPMPAQLFQSDCLQTRS
jgi:hypothetical protein